MSTNQQPAQPATRYGEVFDRGYAHYDGPRNGRSQAFRSLVVYSMKRAMGIRKSWTAKILPFLLYFAAIVPLIVMIGIDAVLPRIMGDEGASEFSIASYTSYMAWTFTMVGIFVAMTAPEIICVDRHERTLPLYFSRAIARSDYVVAKIVAITMLTMTLSLVPSVILWLGRQLTSKHVWQSMQDNIGDLGKVVLVGSTVALVLGIVGLALSSITNRKGVAITVILIGFLVLTFIGNVGLEILEDYEWSKYFIFLSLADCFRAFSIHLFDDQRLSRYDAVLLADLSFQTYCIYFAAIFAVGVLFLRWRYRPTDD